MRSRPPVSLPAEFTSLSPAALRRRLLVWYRRRARDLPWRRRRDPYATWISEVMLQQTQVASVIPFFQRFLEVLPDLRSLAAASEETVLGLWQGLGYYRRARSLHQAARRLVELGWDDVPDDPDLLATLPGLGRYTVNAILSQAFDRPLPILEANSRRVLARMANCRQPVDRGPGEKLMWRAAESLLPHKGAGEFNQALMELGALVCTPQRPACEECPWRTECPTRARGWQDIIPVAAKRPAPTEVVGLALLIRREEHYLIVRRPPEGRWGGLWEFPHLEHPQDEEPAAAAERLAAALGLRVDLEGEFREIRFGVTRFRIRLVAWNARSTGGEFTRGRYAEGRWLDLDTIRTMPLSAPQRRLVQALERPCHKPLF